jgi:hypothetical protein
MIVYLQPPLALHSILGYWCIHHPCCLAALLQPRQLGLGLDERDDDDNMSDMSALPEDVRDAIENSDPGE